MRDFVFGVRRPCLSRKGFYRGSIWTGSKTIRDPDGFYHELGNPLYGTWSLLLGVLGSEPGALRCGIRRKLRLDTRLRID